MELAFLWLGLAVAAGVVGSSKGRSGFGWFLLGLLFSLIALIIVACLPSKRAMIIQNGPTPTPRTHVKCPDCKELVLMDARVCKHCRCRLLPMAA